MIAPVVDEVTTGDHRDVGRLAPVERRWARGGTLLAVVVFWLLATCLQPWNLFQRGPYTTDFYDVQARSIVHGHLDVPADVAGIEGFVVDGRTQIYFGIGPTLLRLPFSGFSDVFDGRLSLLSELLAVGVIGLAAARLLGRARSSVAGAPCGSPWWFAVIAAGVTLGTPLLFFASSPVVYHEAELWGAAAGLAGIDLVVRWWREPSGRHLVEAIALATFALACRPSSGAGPTVALGIFGLVLMWRRRWGTAAVVLVGSLIPLVGFAIVNHARFGSPFGVPFPLQVFSQFNPDRQAMLRDNHGSFFGPKFAPTNLVRYFSPVAVSFQRLFPFVTWPAKATVIGGVTFDTVDRSGSIVTGAPAFIPFALVGAWWTLVRDRAREWSVVAVATVVSTFSTLTIAYVAHRYLADLVPTLVVLSAVGAWSVARAAASWSRSWRRLLLVALTVVAAFGAWNQLGLAITTRAFSILPKEAAARSMAEVQYSIDDWLFGGAPPDVIEIGSGPLPSDPSAGTIAVVGACDALFRYDGYNWMAIERRAGTHSSFELSGSFSTAVTPVLSGADWSIVARPTPEGEVLEYIGPDGTVVRSEPFAVPDGAVTLDITIDPPPRAVLEVRVDGAYVFGTGPVDHPGAAPAPGWSSAAGSAPFCDSLVERFRR